MDIKDILKGLPNNPGIYKMINAEYKIIYIGKAKFLKKRVSSYFNKNHTDLKTQILVSKIVDIEIIVTNTEQEALILERQLVRKFKPRYNILLKDDKSFPYIKVTNTEPFPRVLVVREKKNDHAIYFGPYPSIGGAKRFQGIINALFPIRDCTKPIERVKKQRKCIQLDLGNCIGPCIYKDVKVEYDHYIEHILMLLKGQNKALISQLKKDMARQSKTQEYEKAAKTRDKIQRLESLYEKQSVDGQQDINTDLWVLMEDFQHIYILNQEIISGKLLSQHGYYFEKNEIASKQRILEKTLTDHYVERQKTKIPIITDTDTAATLNHCDIANLHQSITIPQRGFKKDLLNLAISNAKLGLKRIEKEGKLAKLKQKAEASLLHNVKETLTLSSEPNWITGCDISHLQGTNIVASAVRFKDGKPYKKEYRKLNIKTVSGKSNDPESLKEASYRIINHYINNKLALPNLLVIDGGQAQLNYAIDALCIVAYEQCDTSLSATKFINNCRKNCLETGVISILDTLIHIISLAKREEEIYFPHRDKTLCLKKSDPTLHLLQRVRDESHRFAVTFQRKKRAPK